MKALKYSYTKVIQQNYGQGWEDVSEYETNSTYWPDKETKLLIRHDLKEYRLLGYPTRVVKRRTVN